MNERIPLLFDRALRPEWIDYALEQWILNTDPTQHRLTLQNYLQGRLQGSEAIAKTVTQLQRCIGPQSVIPHERLRLFYEMMSGHASGDRSAIRLTLLEESNPFFSDCLNAFRKIDLLGQNGVTVAQLYDRLIALYGDRTTVKRSLQRALQTLGDLGLAQRRGGKWTLLYHEE